MKQNWMIRPNQSTDPTLDGIYIARIITNIFGFLHKPRNANDLGWPLHAWLSMSMLFVLENQSLTRYWIRVLYLFCTFDHNHENITQQNRWKRVGKWLKQFSTIILYRTDKCIYVKWKNVYDIGEYYQNRSIKKKWHEKNSKKNVAFPQLSCFEYWI